jgi:hypothetical protein
MPEVFMNKVQVLLRLQRFAPAADTMERLTTVQPATPSMFLSLGDIQHAAGRSEAARASWREALRLLGATGDVRMRDALLSRLDPPLSP